MTYTTYEHGGIYDKNFKIKYDFSVNVNPLGMPEKVRRDIAENISLLEKYPNMNDCALLAKLSAYHTLPEEYFVLGNGASEIITLLSQAIIPRGAMIPVPTFSGYKKALASRNCRVTEYILRSEDNFRLTEDFILSVKRASTVDAIFICNPNNPTGALISRELVKKLADFCENFGIYLIIDECFMGFVPDEKKTSAVSLIKDHPHLIIIDAFTKLYCLPGLRLGYCICSNQRILSELNALKPEWNISSLALLAGEESVSETEYVKDSVSFIENEKKFLANELSGLGFTVFNSDTNFILTRLPLSMLTTSQSHLAGSSLTDRLAREHGILLRNCANFSGLDNSYFRIAVRNHDENIALIDALIKELHGNSLRADARKL